MMNKVSPEDLAAHGTRETFEPDDSKGSAEHADYILDPKAPLRTARHLVELRYTHRGDRTLQHQQGVFLAWTGTHYRDAAEEELRAEIYAFLEEALVATPTGPQRFNPTTNSVNQVLDALRAVCQLEGTIRPPAWLDDLARPPASGVIACQNGLLHLQTRTLRAHTPIFFSTTALPYDFDPDAHTPKEWLKFLKTIWDADPESWATLQEIFGYFLAADTGQQKIFLLVGPARSGKGTIGRVLTGMLGADAVVSPTLASLETNFGVAPLIGKSAATIGDARLGGRADQAKIAERLLSISGEDSQTIDRKYLPAWTGRLTTRFLIISNELPRIADASGALASRFIVLNLTLSFLGKEDRGLTNRCLTELPGILNWALDGWQRLSERGYFLQPTSSSEAIQHLEDLGSPIKAFIRERCDIDPRRSIAAPRLYDAYREWCVDQGRDHAATVQTFGRDLHAAMPGLKTSQPYDDQGRRDQRVYMGIGLR